jgi:hypothetical protein
MARVCNTSITYTHIRVCTFIKEIADMNIMLTRSTAIAAKPHSHSNSVKESRDLKSRLEAEQQEEMTSKFVANGPMLLFEVSLFLFRFLACYMK